MVVSDHRAARHVSAVLLYHPSHIHVVAIAAKVGNELRLIDGNSSIGVGIAYYFAILPECGAGEVGGFGER